MDKKERDLFMEQQTDLINDFISRQEKTVPELIAKEFKVAFKVLGIDSEKPFRMQKRMLWVDMAMKREETVKSKILTKVTTLVVNIIVTLVIVGFFFIYCQNQIPVMIKNERIKAIQTQIDKNE